MLKSTYNKGFQMSFKNGLTISVQFGNVNYCERRNFTADINSELNENIIESNNAEIAIWDENNNWLNFGSDEVKGWITPEEIAKWIFKVSIASNLNNLKNE